MIGGLWYGNESARRALKVQTVLRGEADAPRRGSPPVGGGDRGREPGPRRPPRIRSAAPSTPPRSTSPRPPGIRAARRRTLELLEATRPKPGEPDFRGFEWGYFRRQAHGELAVRKLPGFAETGMLSDGTPALSADGGLAAIVEQCRGRGNPAVVLIRETTTGRLVREIPVLNRLQSLDSWSPGRTALAFSADGARIALASATLGGGTADQPPLEAHAFVWSLADGRELLHRSWSIAGDGVYPEVALDRDRLAHRPGELDLRPVGPGHRPRTAAT